jgi:hypothetical protein
MASRCPSLLERITHINVGARGLPKEDPCLRFAISHVSWFGGTVTERTKDMQNKNKDARTKTCKIAASTRPSWPPSRSHDYKERKI